MSSTGFISGTLMDIFNPGNYTFTISNIYGSIQLIIFLSYKYFVIPSIISVNNYVTLTAGIKYENLSLVIGRGYDIYFTVKPELPNGLYLNCDNGLISGIAIYESEKTYTFYIENINGTSSVDVLISIHNPETPIFISKVDKYTFYSGISYNVSLFNISGNDLYYSVNPSLPLGLIINKDGRIIGKTTGEYPIENYTFIIEYLDAKFEIDILINVELPDIPLLVESNNIISLYAGITYKDYSLFEAEGKNLSYRIYPELPCDLSFSENNGTLSGYCLEIPLNYTTNYSVFIGNSFGMIRVDFIVNITYLLRPIIFVDIIENTTINFITGINITSYKLFPTVGENLIHSIDETLPNGLNFRRSTGEIFGVPDEESPLKDYVYTIRSNNLDDNLRFKLSVTCIIILYN